MRPFTIFNIVLAIVSIILVLAGAIMLGRNDGGYFILYGGLILAAIFSITSIIDVAKASLSPKRRIVWLIMVICVPVFGGLLYYVIQHGKGAQPISAQDSLDRS
jgi:hypothetical protein